MKKFTIILLASLLLIGINSKVFSQSIKTGDMTIDVYYGYPYLWGALVKNAYRDASSPDSISVFNLNHVGARFEYMVNDKVGLGVEYSYALVRVKFPGTGGRTYEAGLKKNRILAKMNVHFANSDNFDPYFCVGAGYSMINLYSTDPADNTDVNLSSVPVAFRLGLGFRYFFNDNFGLNAEVGLGGPLMQAGLTFKF